MKFRLLLGVLFLAANAVAAETRVCAIEDLVEVASHSVPGAPIHLSPGSCTVCGDVGPCSPPTALGGLSPATLKALVIGGGAAAAVGIGTGAAAGAGAFDGNHSGEKVRSREQ